MTVETTRDGPVFIVTNNRPEARNAVDPETADALFAAFQAFNADPAALACVFTGAGGAFCGGWDLKYASSLTDRDDFDRDIRRGPRLPHSARPPPRAARWGRAAWSSTSP